MNKYLVKILILLLFISNNGYSCDALEYAKLTRDSMIVLAEGEINAYDLSKNMIDSAEKIKKSAAYCANKTSSSYAQSLYNRQYNLANKFISKSRDFIAKMGKGVSNFANNMEKEDFGFLDLLGGFAGAVLDLNVVDEIHRILAITKNDMVSGYNEIMENL